MSEPRRPGDLSHLERLIDRWSKADSEDRVPAGRLRRLVGVSVLAAMLEGLAVDGTARLAFKGGAALELRFGSRARASRDVDAVVSVSIDERSARSPHGLRSGGKASPVVSPNGWRSLAPVLSRPPSVAR